MTNKLEKLKRKMEEAKVAYAASAGALDVAYDACNAAADAAYDADVAYDAAKKAYETELNKNNE